MPLNHRFHPVISCLSPEWHFGAVSVKFLAEPYYCPKDGQFAKHCQTPHNNPSCFSCLSSDRHFGALTVKFSLNPITKQPITNLQNTVTRLEIIVFSKCFGADHQSEFFELLRWNLHWTPSWPKTWPIWNTLSQASYSPFSATFFVRIM